MDVDNGKDVLADLRYDRPGDPLDGMVPDHLRAEADRRLRYREGNEAGHCFDCGLPVWWRSERLVTRSDMKWCLGPRGARVIGQRWHALPGMPQYVTPSPAGKVCHCLDRAKPHIHQVIEVEEDPLERALELSRLLGEAIQAVKDEYPRALTA